MPNPKRQEVIIDLNKPKSSILREDKMESILNRLQERIEHIDTLTNHKNEFNELRDHDAILIDGRRGSGKTTFLAQLKDYIQKDNRILVLDIIDPALIQFSNDITHPKVCGDILLMFISRLYLKIVKDIQKNYQENELLQKKLFNHLEKINNIIVDTFTEHISNSKDYHDRLHTLSSSLSLDYELHKLFKRSCEFFNKKIVVLLIDDTDMEFKVAFRVLDSIRRYLSSPRVVPIVAVDSSYIHAISKKYFLEFFKMNTKEPLNKIKSETDLAFLKSLPRSYLLKIFAPHRRVEMDNMSTLYEYYTANLDSKVLIFEYTNNRGIKFRFNKDELLKLLINVIYGAIYKNLNTRYLDTGYQDYLEHLSFRGFIADTKAVLESISKNSKGEYIISKKDFKEKIILRFINYPQKHYVTISAISDLWERFIQNAKFEEKEEFIGSIVYRTINVRGYDNSINRFVKTYLRLWLQNCFFEGSFKLEAENQKENLLSGEVTVQKSLNLYKMIEVSIRTFLPMNIIKIKEEESNYQITNNDIMFLRDISNAKFLKLFHIFNFLENKFIKREEYNEYFIKSSEFNDISLIDLIIFSKLSKGSRVSINNISFFKSLTFLMKYIKVFMYDNYDMQNEDDKKEYFKKILFMFLPQNCETVSAIISKNDNTINDMLENILISQKDKDNLIFKNLNNIFFNSISINDFSERFIINFIKIWSNFDRLKDKEIKKEYIYKIYSDFITVFINSLLVEFIQSLKIANLPIYTGLIENGIKHFDKNKYLELQLNNFFVNLVRLSNYVNDNRNNKKMENKVNTIKEIINKSIWTMRLPIWREIIKSSYGLDFIFIVDDKDTYKIVFCKNKDISDEYSKIKWEIKTPKDFYNIFYKKMESRGVINDIGNNFYIIEGC